MSAMAQFLQPGQRLGGYQVLELVGRGGMGEVYRANQLSMERIVALKILAPRLVKQDPAFAQRFEDEARAAGRLNHPNLIAVHDVGTAPPPEGSAAGSDPVHYFSMEFVDGESVRDVIQREGQCPPATVALVMAGMAEALVYAESAGIVHRDIKPDNIMITSMRIVKLADLGLAMQMDGEEGLVEKDEQGRGKVMGTPLYMSPEQARAIPLDHRSDQYSLGATLYHMLTGQQPFRGDNARAIMKAHVFSPIPDPGEVREAIPEAWRGLCMRLMAKAPEDRFANALDLRDAVRAAITGRPPAQSRRTRPARASVSEERRGETMPTWAWLIVGGFVVAVVTAVGLGIEWGSRPEAPPPPPVVPANPGQAAGETPAVARATQALAALPDEPGARWQAVQALAADARLTDAKARSLVDAEVERCRVLVETHRRDALATRVRAIEAQIAGGRWAEVDQAIDSLSTDAAAASDADRQTAVTTLRGRLAAALQARMQDFAQRVAGANAPAELDGAIAGIDDAGLGEERVATVRALAAKRRTELIAAAVADADAADRSMWRGFALDLMDQRLQARYAPFQTTAAAAAEALNGAESRLLARALEQLGRDCVTAEALLRAHLPNRAEPVSLRLRDGPAQRVRITAITLKEITYTLLRSSNAVRVDRTQVILPLDELLAEALEDAPLDGQDPQRIKAAYLWMWRAPEADEALSRLGDQSMARAVRLIEERARLVDAAGSVTRTGDLVTVSYDFTSADEALIPDFVGDGIAYGERGLRWTTSAVAAGNQEAGIPTLRWKTAIAAPCTVEARFHVDPLSTIAIGLSAGGRTVRAACNNRTPHKPVVGIIQTAGDGATAERQAAKWPGGIQRFPNLSDSRLIRLVIEAKADGAIAITWDGERFANDLAPLPAGQPIALAIQSVQFSGKSGIELVSLAVTMAIKPTVAASP